MRYHDLILENEEGKANLKKKKRARLMTPQKKKRHHRSDFIKHYEITETNLE